MNKRLFVPAILALIISAAPVAAFAQQQPNWQNQPAPWQHRDGDDRQDQHGPPPGHGNRGRRDDRRDRDDHRDRDDRGNNGRWNGNQNSGNGRYGNQNYGGQLNGIVTSFSAFNLQLNNGEHVNLHQGTIINPTGTTLRPGMRVAIYGRNTGNGTYEADQINVIGNGYSQYGNGNYPNGNLGVGASVLTNVLGQLGL